MSLLVYYVICVICISKKLKYLKNEARESKTERQLAYSVILSVLSNKTNLILGFISPLRQYHGKKKSKESIKRREII